MLALVIRMTELVEILRPSIITYGSKYKTAIIQKQSAQMSEVSMQNCFCLCSSSDFYNMHLKHCLDVNDGQKTIFPIRGKNDRIQFNKFGANSLTPLSSHSILRVN